MFKRLRRFRPDGGRTSQSSSSAGGIDNPVRANGPMTPHIRLICGFSPAVPRIWMCRIFCRGFGQGTGTDCGGGKSAGFRRSLFPGMNSAQTRSPDGYTTLCHQLSGHLHLQRNWRKIPAITTIRILTCWGNHVSDYGTVCWKTDETRWSDFQLAH